MSLSDQPLFLGGDAFQMLVHRVPDVVVSDVPPAEFEAAIGTSKARFEFIVQALRAGKRTQCFIGHETAGYLQHALGASVLVLGPPGFEARIGFTQEEGFELLRQLERYNGRVPTEVS